MKHQWNESDKGFYCSQCSVLYDKLPAGGLPMEGCNPNSGESKNVSSDDTGTVRKVLKEALKQNTFGEGGFAGDRILCIGLNGKEQGFKPAFLSSGLSQAELIAVLELCSTYLKADICSQNLQLFNVEE